MWFTRAMREGSARDAVLYKNCLAILALTLAATVLGSGRGGGAALGEEIPWLVAAGSLGLGLGDFLLFASARHLGIGRALLLSQLNPVLTALGAVPVLGEHLGPFQWLGVALVVGGGALVQSRRAEAGRGDAAGVVLALCAALCFAANNLIVRYGLVATQPITAAAWRLTGGCATLLLLAAWRGELRGAVRGLASPAHARLYLLPSLLGTGGGLTLLSAAQKWTYQGVAASLASASPLFAVPLAAVFLHERPGRRGWIGTLVIVGGVFALAVRL